MDKVNRLIMKQERNMKVSTQIILLKRNRLNKQDRQRALGRLYIITEWFQIALIHDIFSSFNNCCCM